MVTDDDIGDRLVVQLKTRWLTEPVRDDVRDLWRLHEVLYEGSTPYQQVLIARTLLGVTLFCDDNPQSAEIGQLAFHEAELVPAMLLAERLDRVLVIGCSEGTVPQIAAEAGAQVDHVDIDPDCVRICAEHLPYGFTLEDVRAAESGDGAIRLHYQDGADFVRAAPPEARYDVIVLDLPEEQEEFDLPHNALYEADFLRECQRLLAPNGVLSTHVSRPYLSLPTADSAASLVRPWRRFGEVFGTRVYFRADEQPWGAIMLGRDDVIADPVARMRQRLTELRYRPRTMDDRALLSATHVPMVLRT
ncbi:spermidine synthase [Bounagaea algeriensis]